MHRGQPCKCTVGSKRNLINRPFFPVCRKNSMKFDRFLTLIILLPPVSAVEVIKRTCLPVCLCVCLLALSGWTVWGMFKKSGSGIDLDCILDEFDGQGHRSKLPGLKMRLSVFFSDLNEQNPNCGLWWNIPVCQPVSIQSQKPIECNLIYAFNIQCRQDDGKFKLFQLPLVAYT